MGAPLGNKFWQNRSKHGRDTIFKSPPILKASAEEYFEWCIANPWVKYEQNRASKPVTDKETGVTTWPDQLIAIPTARPFTLHALRLYLGVSINFFNEFKHALKGKLQNRKERGTLETETEEQEAVRIQEAEDFLGVITYIEDTIYNQKYEGAAVGTYNANIIARDLGLRDSQDNHITGNVHLSKEPTTFE